MQSAAKVLKTKVQKAKIQKARPGKARASDPRPASQKTSAPPAIEPRSGPLERYIQILEALAASPGGMTSRELETVLELPKTTVNRLVHALGTSGLVAHSGRGGRFEIGGRLRRMLESDTAWIETASRRRLKTLAADTGETCFIARLFGSEIQSLIMESPDASVGIYVVPGHVLAPHATATGKLLTAFQERALREAILQTELKRLTSRTVLDRRLLEAEYKRIREQGYAIEDGEHVQGLYTIACPISLSPGYPPIYAVGLTGPAERVRARAIPEFLRRLQSTADELARVFMPKPELRS
jgi:DNA-binding IclR family transcriptional regulator